MASDYGNRALELINKLLAEKPHKIGHEFSEATRCLTAYRDQLIERWRSSRGEPDRKRLEQTNAVLSVLVGAHYPRGDIPWPDLEKARETLAGLVVA